MSCSRRARRLAASTLAIVALVLAACGTDTPDGYSAATESVFLETCATGLGAGERAVCECTYDRLVDEVAFDDYLDLDQEVRDDPTEVPATLRAIAVGCAADALSPVAPTTTTIPKGTETTVG